MNKTQSQLYSKDNMEQMKILVEYCIYKYGYNEIGYDHLMNLCANCVKNPEETMNGVISEIQTWDREDVHDFFQEHYKQMRSKN